jgi:Fe-S-cluster-containing hydrogenase component 2
MGRAAPDEPTRIANGPLEPEQYDGAPDGWALADGSPRRGNPPRGYAGSVPRARGRNTSRRFDHSDEPLFGDAVTDDLAPFSAERAQPLYAPADPEVLELLTSDIDLSDLSDEVDLSGQADQADRTDNQVALPPSEREPSIEELDSDAVQIIGSAPAIEEAPTNQAAMPAHDRRSQPRLEPTAAVPALQLSRRPIARDFDEDLATRVREAFEKDPELELSLSDSAVELQNEHDFDDRSVVRRIVKSVVAALPRAFQAAAEKSGLIRLPESSGGSSGSGVFGINNRDARALGIDTRAWREARTAPIFDGLPNDALKEALLSRKLQILRVDRDTIVPVGGGLVLVRSGQVALGQFPADKLEIERDAAEKLLVGNPLIGKKLDKKERRRRAKAGPLMRQAEKNLATFEEGDVVEISVGARRHDTLGIYSVTPVTVLTIDREVAERWRSAHPFMADRLRRAGASARARVEATSGAKAVVADFFIRHGLSVSLTLRVRKLDTCIECGACEKACEERYGGKRLSLNGRILGNLDFVDACHTCTDQRCVDPCNFDAIRFDPARKEVLINESNCTGCTLCAVACPYDAIEMYELDDKPRLKLRLEKAGALNFGDGAGRKAQVRRMASKCDHCAFYEDQACISACPTGALIEIMPSDVVSQMPDQARQTARAGFDRTIVVDVNALNQVDTFARKGLSQLPELGRARARRGRLSIGFWWFVGIMTLAAACVEIALRKFVPERSVAYFILTRAEGFERDLALTRVDYRPGCELAVNLGYVGTALMITGLAYVWRRRMPFMRNVGSLRSWFDWHVLSGVLGPSFILLHSAAKLDNWVSLAFWSMVATVLSGLLGRYLTTQLPQAANVATVETLEIDRQLGKLRIEHNGVRVADGWFEDYRRRLAAFELRLDGPQRPGSTRALPAPTAFGGVIAFFWMLKDDLARGRRSRGLSRSLKASVRGPGARKIRRRAHALAMRLERLERRRVLLPRLEPLFLRWKAIHVPMAVSLTVIATIHIFLALTQN